MPPASAADPATFRARCDQEFLDRLPIVALGLAAIHILHLVLIGAWAPPDANGVRWQELSLLWHAAALAIIGGLGLARAGGVRLSPFFVRWAIIVSYVVFGSVVSATDILRGIPPIGLGASLLGLATVFQFEVPMAGVLFAGAAGIASASAGAFNPPDIAVTTLNACAIAGVAFVVAVTASSARWKGNEQTRLTEAANAHLEALNRRLGEEIERRIQVEAELERLASRDPLTNLLNRRAFVLTLTQALRKERPGVVLLVDLDNFKAVNDTSGHAAGDAVLTTVATALRTGVRTDDVVARLGGDELAVLLVSAPLEEAARLAESLRAAVAVAHVQHASPPITVSIGGAAGSGAETVDAWLERADRALYAAKGAGRNRVALAD